jgi:hypothetical protein
MWSKYIFSVLWLVVFFIKPKMYQPPTAYHISVPGFYVLLICTDACSLCSALSVFLLLVFIHIYICM